MHINMVNFSRYSTALCIGACLSFLIACDDDDNNETTAGEMTAGEATAGETTAGETTAGETTAGETTAGETTAGETTAGEATAGEMTAGEATAGEMTAGEATAGEATAGEATAGEATAGEMSAGSDSMEAFAQGQIPEAYSEYCIAEFTEDYAVTDFDIEVFTARAGERYLLVDDTVNNPSQYNDDGSVTTLKGLDLLLLTEEGPYRFSVLSEEIANLPITNNCRDFSNHPVYSGDDAVEQYSAVFVDTTFYTDSSLTEEACTLSKNTIGIGFSGYGSLRGEDVPEMGPRTFEINFGEGLSEACNGLSSAWTSAPYAPVGSEDHLIPAANFLKAAGE